MKPRIVFHVFAVLLLVAAVAAAQSPKQKTKSAPVGASADRESSTPSVSEREVGSGMPSGKRQHEDATVQANPSGTAAGRESSQPSVSEAGISMNAHSSGHAAGKRSDAQSNPTYKDNGRSGTNPLFEAKDKAVFPGSGKGNGSKPSVIEYKDGEDGVSHTRPGNHKPSK